MTPGVASPFRNDTRVRRRSPRQILPRAAQPILGILQSYRYSVMEIGEPLLPLGDSMAVFHIDGPRGFRTFTQADESVLAVFLPITPTVVLWGARSDYTLNVAGLPSAIAQCSLEHFIAHERSPQFEGLQAQIGETATLLSNAEIEAMLAEALDE